MKRISYSTCSIHQIENEQVVHRILDTHSDWKLQMALPTWPRRGETLGKLLRSEKVSPAEDEARAKCMIRCMPNEDQTNGFFVALFERK